MIVTITANDRIEEIDAIAPSNLRDDVEDAEAEGDLADRGLAWARKNYPDYDEDASLTSREVEALLDLISHTRNVDEFGDEEQRAILCGVELKLQRRASR